MEMQRSHLSIKEEADLVNADRYHSSRGPAHDGVKSRSLSTVSWTSDSLRANSDDGEAQTDSYLDACPCPNKAYCRKLFAQHGISCTLKPPSYDMDDHEHKPLGIKLEDQQFSDSTSHQRFSTSPSLSSSNVTSLSSLRSNTPVVLLDLASHRRQPVDPSLSHGLRSRHRDTARAIPISLSLSRTNANVPLNLLTRSQPKPTSELIDEKRSVFVKQEEAKSSVSACNLSDTPVQTPSFVSVQDFPSRDSSPTVSSCDASDVDEQATLGQEFSVRLFVLHSVSELVLSDCGVHLGQRTSPKSLSGQQAQKIHNQLLLVESAASDLRQLLALHFPALIQSDVSLNDTTCGSSNTVVPPQTQRPDFTNLTPTPDLDWSYNVDSNHDLYTSSDLWKTPQPTSCLPYAGASGFDSNQTAPQITAPIDGSFERADLPVLPLASDMSTFPIFGTQDVSGLNLAAYYNTTGQVYYPSLENTAGMLPDPSLFAMPSDPTFSPDLVNQLYNLPYPNTVDTSNTLLHSFALSSFETTNPPAHSDSHDATLHASSTITPIPDSTAAPQTAPETSDGDTTKILCDVDGCGKTFRRPYLLRDHMRTHSGESSVYHCSFEGCDKRFGSQSNLTRHSKTHLKRDKTAHGANQHDGQDERMFSPDCEASTGLASTQDSATPRRSRRLKNTALNSLGRYRILEPRTPASVSARAQRCVA